MISNLKRFMTEKITSVEDDILYYQHGVVTSLPNASSTFIPNPMKDVVSVDITPIKLGTVSANGVALFTTAVGYEIDGFDNPISSLPDWSAVAFQPGAIVKSSGKAYICTEAHTGSGSIDLTKFRELSATKFIRLVHTAAGAGKVVSIEYLLTGYYQ